MVFLLIRECGILSLIFVIFFLNIIQYIISMLNCLVQTVSNLIACVSYTITLCIRRTKQATTPQVHVSHKSVDAALTETTLIIINRAVVFSSLINSGFQIYEK